MLCVVFLCYYIFGFVCHLYFFFFKQKTAYEMRISDWSSDVCSSDLMYAMPDSPAIIAKIRAAAQGFASIGGKVEQTDEVWEDFFPGFIATASGIGHNYSRHELPKPPMAELKRALDLRGRNWERFRDRKSTRLNSSH